MSSPTWGAAEMPRQVTNPTALQPAPPARQATPASPAGPMCMEIPVRVQGSQVILHGTTEHPEFFEEYANTLILFPQGAVIRLAANVKAGQKLALTNQKTNEDVLCLVVNVRNYPSVKNYVEIEFTRTAPTFWDVNVPAKAPAPASAQEAKPVVSVPMAAPKPREASVDSASPATSVNVPAKAPAPAPAPERQAVLRAPVAAPKPRDASVDSAFPATSATDSKRDSASVPGTQVSPGVPKRSASLERASFAEPAASPLRVEPKQAGATSYYAPPPARANERANSLATSERSKEADGVKVPATATLNRPGARVATVESRSKGPAADRALPAAYHVGEDNSHEKALPLSPDTWELSTPALGPSNAEATRSAAPHSEPGKQPIAASSVAAAASERMAGVAARPFQGWRNPFGRLQQEASLGEHSSDSEDFGISLGGQSLPSRRLWPKLVLRFAYTALFLSVVGGGAILFHRQFGVTFKTAAAPSDVTPSEPSPSIDAPAAGGAGPSGEAEEAADMQRPLATSNTSKAPPVKPQSIADQPVPATDAPATAASKAAFLATPPEAVASKPVARVRAPEKRAVPADAAAVAPSPPPTSEAPLNSLRVSGEVKAPQLLHSVQPEYPALSREDRVEGDVTVQVDITAAGKVARAKAVSGPVVLRQAAVNALRQWGFKPATVSGKPVPIQMLVTVKFQLPK